MMMMMMIFNIFWLEIRREFLSKDIVFITELNAIFVQCFRTFSFVAVKNNIILPDFMQNVENLSGSHLTRILV